MTRSLPLAVAAALLSVVLAGCATPAPAPVAAPTPPAVAPVEVAPAEEAPVASAEPQVAVSRTGERAAAAASRTPRIDAPPVTIADEPGRVVSVDGIVLVNKKNPLASDHVPAWVKERNGLHPHVSSALDQLVAAARADGLKVVLRSGYRSYAEQRAIHARELKRQPAATVALYYAEAGRSEHQTGLAVDVWDGVRRGTAFKRTPQAAWLAEHAWEFGFIVRYPDGRTDVTGYAHEPWHLRYVGTEVSRQFGPHAQLTLEEFLGRA